MNSLTGQIGLCMHGKGWFSWLIHKITKSPANHVVIAISPRLCIGAEPGGARIRRIDEFDDIVWSRFQLKPRERHAIVTWVHHREGIKYSWLADIAIAVAKITKTKSPLWLERFLASDKEYECAQLAQCAYLHAGIDLFDGKYLPGEVYPGSFVPVFKENGWL